MELVDLAPSAAAFYEDVVQGLNCDPKRLPCKYFYDRRGSRLFDRICELDEYYLTRAELEIMQRHAASMAECIGPSAMVIEFGSGSSVKTRILLDHLVDPVAYVPVDISRGHLLATARELAGDYPSLRVRPVCADFSRPFRVPKGKHRPRQRVVYFPGSTIGNFGKADAQRLLDRAAKLGRGGGGLLIGIDLQKDLATLKAAYNDRVGVTAEFNRNVLRRINRELDGDFDLEKFHHDARYNSNHDRIEMHLVSAERQVVRVGSEQWLFDQGESICTEHSHKYNIDQFTEMGTQAGLKLLRSWTDRRERFGVLYFTVA